MKRLRLFTRRVRIADVVAPMFAGLASADTLEMALERDNASAAWVALEAEIVGKPDADIHRGHLEGMILVRQGDLRKAEVVFRSILAETPGFEPARVQLVIVPDKLGGPRSPTQGRSAGRDHERCAAARKADAAGRHTGPIGQG
jgi:hypothetical protein